MKGLHAICNIPGMGRAVKNLNPLSIVMKLTLVRLDLTLKSNTAMSSVLVISH